MNTDLSILFENGIIKVLMPEIKTYNNIEYKGVQIRIYYNKTSSSYILSLLNEEEDEIFMVCDYYDFDKFDLLIVKFSKLINMTEFINDWGLTYLIKTIENYNVFYKEIMNNNFVNKYFDYYFWIDKPKNTDDCLILDIIKFMCIGFTFNIFFGDVSNFNMLVDDIVKETQNFFC